MYRRPSLSEYVIARLITLVIFVTFIFSFILIITPDEFKNIYFYISIFVASQIILLISVYYGTKCISKELKNVEDYLSGVIIKIKEKIKVTKITRVISLAMTYSLSDGRLYIATLNYFPSSSRTCFFNLLISLVY